MKISEEQEKKDKEADELNKEYKEKILIDNQEHWMTLKKFKSSLGYKMKYDVESFYIENNDIEVDEYKSLYIQFLLMLNMVHFLLNHLLF